MNTTSEKRPIGTCKKEAIDNNRDFLNHMLANEFGLFTKTLNYHWNVTGPRFHSLHVFLEGQYKTQLEIMDSIAERVRTIGETPYSTVERMKGAMDMKEQNGRSLSSSQMIEDLFNTNINIQESIKEKVKQEEDFRDDPGTEDFLVGLLQKHETMSWMLKSHLD